MLLCIAWFGHITWVFLYIDEIGATQQNINGKILRMAADHWEPWSIVPEVSGLPSLLLLLLSDLFPRRNSMLGLTWLISSNTATE